MNSYENRIKSNHIYYNFLYEKLGEKIHPFWALYKRYKKRAAVRKLDFKLNERDFYWLVSGKCFYCNCDPNTPVYSDYIKKQYPFGNNYFYNGIDRTDNDLGYINGNVVTCCYSCNQSKRRMEKDRFLQTIKMIYEHMKLGNE